MIKAVIFDLDHTLFDRHKTLAAIVPQLRQKFEVNTSLTDEQIGAMWSYADDRFVYTGWKYIFDYLVENHILLGSPDFGEYRTFIFENFGKVAIPFANTLPMLQELKRKNYKIGLITNGQHALQYKKLELIGLRYIFDEIIISGDVGIDKPDREIFNLMLQKLSLKPEEAVYVGDNPINDISGAHSAGMRTVWMKSTGLWIPKAPKPDYEVNTVEEIPFAIEQINQTAEQKERKS